MKNFSTSFTSQRCRTMTAVSLMIGFLSCNPEKITTQTDKDGVVTQLPFIWKSSISDGEPAFGLYQGYVVDGKGLLCVAGRKSSNPVKTWGDHYLQLKDVDTGKNIWSWDDFDGKGVSSMRDNIRLYDGKLFLHDYRWDYLINTRTGTTIWKRRNELPSIGPKPSFANDKFYIRANSPANGNRIEDGIYEGDINNGDVKELTKPHYSTEYSTFTDPYYNVGFLLNTQTFTRDNMEYIVVPFTEIGPETPYGNNRSFFGLFNITTRKWVYDRIPLSLPGESVVSSVTPVIDRDQVFLTSGNWISCFDLMTGKNIWQRKLTDTNSSFHEIVQVGNKLIVNSMYAYMYCLDADTGATVWELESASTSNVPYHQNGIIYGIRSKNLIAIDIGTGRLIWNMRSVREQNEGRFDSPYSGFVTGLPAKDGGKGKIFAMTDMAIYCFEAAR